MTKPVEARSLPGPLLGVFVLMVAGLASRAWLSPDFLLTITSSIQLLCR